MKHIQPAKVEKINEDFIFKIRQKMTKSGSLVTHCVGKKLKSLKTIYFRELSHLETLNFFFEFGDKNDNLETAPKKWVPDFSQT